MKLRKLFDDSPKHSDKWEPYFEVYERHLPKSTPHLLKIVEVGTQRGGSLEMWSQHFKYMYGSIIGIDIDPECAKLTYDDPRIQVVIGDQGDPKFWDDFLQKHPKIDIFIDDGGHFMDQQILTFEKVFPTMPIGGIYICEDCHTSYMPYNGGGLGNRRSFIEYAKTYVDIIHQGWWSELDTELERKKVIGKDLTSVHFYDSMCIFEKFGKQEMKRVFPKQFS